jgi:hypothetical protein
MHKFKNERFLFYFSTNSHKQKKPHKTSSTSLFGGSFHLFSRSCGLSTPFGRRKSRQLWQVTPSICLRQIGSYSHSTVAGGLLVIS